MEQPLNPPPAQRVLSLLSKSTHLCQKSADVRPHQQNHQDVQNHSRVFLVVRINTYHISGYFLHAISVFSNKA